MLFFTDARLRDRFGAIRQLPLWPCDSLVSCDSCVSRDQSDLDMCPAAVLNKSCRLLDICEYMLPTFLSGSPLLVCHLVIRVDYDHASLVVSTFVAKA